MTHKVTIGADPEFFVYDLKKSMIIPACGKIGGSKKAGLPLGDANGTSVLEDGAALEYNFNPVEHEPGSKRFLKIHSEVRATISEYAKSKGLGIYERSHTAFTDDVIAKHKDALKFGCDPDFAGHEFGAPLPVLDAAHYGGTRCVGGHVHFGYPKGIVPDFAVVQMIEALIFAEELRQTELNVGDVRATMYGRAGAFRPKPYGVEYRTPSNYWAYRDNTYWILAAGDLVHWIVNNPNESRQLYDSIDFGEVRTEIESLHPSDEFTVRMNELLQKFCGDDVAKRSLGYGDSKKPVQDIRALRLDAGALRAGRR